MPSRTIEKYPNLLVGRTRPPDPLLAGPEHLAVGLLPRGRDAHRVQEPVRGEPGRPTAFEPVAIRPRADRDEPLRGGDDLRGEAFDGVEAAEGQAEAGRPRPVGDEGDLPANQPELSREELGPGGLDLGGWEAESRRRRRGGRRP